MPKGDSPGADAARQQLSQSLSDLAKQAQELGQPLPDIERPSPTCKPAGWTTSIGTWTPPPPT